jgi:DNA-binding XRE family transcriptional regulator
MTTKEKAGQKLLVSKKTAEELAIEEYQKQLELAIENH